MRNACESDAISNKQYNSFIPIGDEKKFTLTDEVEIRELCSKVFASGYTRSYLMPSFENMAKHSQELMTL